MNMDRMQNTTSPKMVLGSDEVGRGSGSGPLMACALVFLEPVEDIGLKDSKKLTPKKRDKIYHALKEFRADGKLDWSLISIPPDRIDKDGIQKSNYEALRIATETLLDKLDKPPQSIRIIIDGSIRMSPVVVNGRKYRLESLVKADADYPTVSAASIVAKVSRDFYMERISLKHPEYGWESNKGYLTKVHCEAIGKYGLTPFHRKSFCTNIGKEIDGSSRRRA